MQVWQEIDARRAAAGLLLCYLGFAISRIPYIKYLGAFLIFISFIYLFLGRQAFSYGHARFIVLPFVIFTLVLWMKSFFSFILAHLFFMARVRSARLMLPPWHQSLGSWSYHSWVPFIRGAYELSSKKGKVILVTGFMIEIYLVVTSTPLFSGSLQYALQQAVLHNYTAPVLGLEAKLRLLGLAGAVPLILFALAYCLERSRILDGTIPEDIDWVPLPRTRKRYRKCVNIGMAWLSEEGKALLKI